MYEDPYGNSELGNLPPEAWGNYFDADGPFDPNDFWLKSASEEEQLIAMREWFLARYCDPAQNTPYTGREGGYQFVNGGPYNPENELFKRFESCVDYEAIQVVVDELHEMVGENWAPLRSDYRDEEYEHIYDIPLETKDKPAHNLIERLNQIALILTLEGDPQARKLVINFALGAAIGALEAYLWEVTYYWVENDDEVYKNIIENLQHFSEKEIKLGNIFKQQEKLKIQVKEYLQNLVWHRWESVGRLFQAGFGFKPPSFKVFSEALEKRHDIIHRSGFDKGGNSVVVSINEIECLRNEILKFSNALEKSLTMRSIKSDFESLEDDFS